MEIDAYLRNQSVDISDIDRLSSKAEQMGFNGLWVTEGTNSPFIQLSIAAGATSRIDIGSAIALAFPRSPMVTAYTAWDLQRLSNGRLKLGLGPQVKGHMKRRFSVEFEWERPGPRLREYVEVLQHLWNAWESESEVHYKGEFYQITLCPENFTPDRLGMPSPDIYVAGVNPYNIKLAGHLCDGLHIHPAHTPKYIDQVVIPNIETGAAIAGRDPGEVTLSTQVFAITGDENEREVARKAVRQRIGFYGSTRTYRIVFELHGWEDVCETLHQLTTEGRYDELSDHVTEEMVDAFSVEADWENLREAIEQRYEYLDRVAIFTSFDGSQDWQHLVD